MRFVAPLPRLHCLSLRPPSPKFQHNLRVRFPGHKAGLNSVPASPPLHFTGGRRKDEGEAKAEGREREKVAGRPAGTLQGRPPANARLVSIKQATLTHAYRPLTQITDSRKLKRLSRKQLRGIVKR